jgi:Ca2+-binding RTX toxin-like protein
MHNHNNHAMPGKTFSLTQGNDRFQGGKGNDTIVAANDTLSAGDVISGGGGTNTLSLISLTKSH